MNNIFENVPENLEKEVFERLVDSEGVSIERIISKGHQSPEHGWYDQNKNEWVLLLQGEAQLLFSDETTIDMKSGDFVNIPAHIKHKVVWTTAETETIWLAIHY